MTIEIVGYESSLAVEEIRTGSEGWPVDEGECLGTAVVARTSSGDEFARLDQPGCEGQTWVIEADEAYLRE